MRFSFRRTNKWKLAFLGQSLLIVLLAIGASGVIPWSRMNCRHILVDINSGRIRQIDYLLFVRFRDTVRGTSVSYLLRDQWKQDPESNWQTAVTVSPGTGHSPHYHYHAAASQLTYAEQVFATYPLTLEAKIYIAKRILELWQEERGDEPVNDFLAHVEGVAGWHEAESGGQTILITKAHLVGPPPWE